MRKALVGGSALGAATLLVLFGTLALAAEPLRAPAGKRPSQPSVAEALALLEVWVEAERAYDRIPGVSMAVVAGDDVLWSRGFGFAHREKEVPATPDTLYSICSISKLFTSIALMQLRDRGALRLDEPIATYLPWFDLRQAHAESPPITLRGILTHSAGLPRESDHPYWTGPEFRFPTREEVVSGLGEQETLYPAERYYQYSNLGMTLAGEVVAAVSGQPYPAYVQRHILSLLGLDDTTPQLPAGERGKRLATGYGRFRRQGERVEMPFFQARGIAAAAGYASTALDLAELAAWQLGLLEEGGGEVLAASTLREMQRVHWVDPNWKRTWGLGFAVQRDGETTVVGHGGSCPGFRTELALVPRAGIGVVFMSNATGVDTRKFTRGAWRILAPVLEEAKAEPSEGELPPDDELDLYTGLYESSWGEAAVLRWKGGLAILRLPSEDPREALMELRHVDGHSFRRLRDDGELGEEVRFELGPAGRVVEVWRHGNAMRKVQ